MQAVEHDCASAEPRFEHERGLVEQRFGEPLEGMLGFDGSGLHGRSAGGFHLEMESIDAFGRDAIPSQFGALRWLVSAGCETDDREDMPLSTHTLRQLSYAEGYLALGLKAEAAEALGEIIEGEREATPVLVMWLAVYCEREKWKPAAEVGAVLCEREPDVAGFWIQAAYATRRHLGILQAREILLRGLGRHPREAVFHFNLACYEAQLGNVDDARGFLETACHLDESFVHLAKTDPDLEPLRAG